MQRKMRMGMIGGGRGAFIGSVHRMAAALDGEIELVCGAFSSNPEKSKLSGEDLMISPDRVYGTYQEMIEKEKNREDGMDFVSIVTPNHVHFEPAKMAMENGFDVICDKPVTFSLEEARELKKIKDNTGRLFALTHNYTGYPLVKEAKQMIKNGEIGKIRKVVVEYPQGWLSTLAEATDNPQAQWRTDPTKSGQGGSLGDIGSHAENLAEYMTGLKITEICADVSILVEGRKLDDDVSILLKFDNGAKGTLWCSQIANGEENGLNIRVYGETGSLHWRQEDPNDLVHKSQEIHRIIRPGKNTKYELANYAIRISPPGHPEGYLEAFATVYKNFARTIRKTKNNEKPNEHDLDFPTLEDGIRGMAFIETAVKSGKSDMKWTPFNN